MESPPTSKAVDDNPLRNIPSPHPLNDVLLVEGFWDDPNYPHLLGQEEWEENFFGLLNPHMASVGPSITDEDELEKACGRFVAKWRAQQPGGRFLRQDKQTQLWNDVGDKEATAFIANRLADAYNITSKFMKAEPRTGAQRVALIFGLERKTTVLNKSSRDINVIIADEKVTCNLAKKVTAGVSVPYVQISGELGAEKTVHPSPAQEAMVLAGDSEDFELNQWIYYLTVFTKNEKNAFIIHMKNRRVLARQNWAFEEEDLKKSVETLDADV